MANATATFSFTANIEGICIFIIIIVRIVAVDASEIKNGQIRTVDTHAN